MLAVLSGLLPAAVHAQPANFLIKASGPAVYYNADNGKRYVFPSEAIYKSWYPDYTQVALINDQQLAAIPLGGNVTYRPGSKLVKITTDPRVYAVSRYGLLHWITSEAVAMQLYGAQWNKHVVDVPDSFFVNYIVSYPIDTAVQYNQSQELAVANPGENIKPESYVPPPQPPASSDVQANPAVLSMSLSSSNVVLNQTAVVYVSVQNSNLPISRIEIYKASQASALSTCTMTDNCSYSLYISTAPLSETFYAVAYDSKGAKITLPEAQRPVLTVSSASDQVQITATPQDTTVGTSVSFRSIATKQNQVSNHKIYALIPGQPVPVLWKDCGATMECAGSTPFYRTTNLYSQITLGGQMLVSPTITVSALGGSAPKPSLAIIGRPAANQVEISVTAPSGDTIKETIIKDGLSLSDKTLALCFESTCSITLQVNVPGSVTAFTNVGGKYEASNTLTVTP